MNTEKMLYDKLFNVYLTLIQKNLFNLFLYDNKYFISGSEIYQAISVIYPQCMDENEVDIDLFQYVSDPIIVKYLIDYIIHNSYSLPDLLDGIHICEYDDLITKRFNSITF